MLIKCPECELQVSDKASNCPHCGYPISADKPLVRRSSKKHMRLPNGFGQITEIKNRNLRRPFRAMVGHKVSDITESTYTVRDIEWLRTDLEKMT